MDFGGFEVSILKQKYKIKASIDKVWEALVDPKVIEEWGGGPAVMSDTKGVEFKLWGGEIWGKNLEVIKNKKLVQEWFGGEWDKPSRVTFTLEGNHDKTELSLLHEDVPDSEVQDIDDGWRKYYFGEIKKLIEK